MELEQRIETLQQGIRDIGERFSKINPCHVKSGPGGGQFCEAGGGGGTGGGSMLGSALSTPTRPSAHSAQSWAKVPPGKKTELLQREKDSNVISAWGPKMQESPFRSRTASQNNGIARDANSMEKAGFTLHEKGASRGDVVVTPKMFAGNTPAYQATVGGKIFGGGQNVQGIDAATWSSLHSALKIAGHLK